MNLLKLPNLKRFLRSPSVIIGELVSITLLSATGATFPQAGTASPAELVRLHQGSPMLAAVVRWLALDHLFSSPCFLLLTALAASSLTVVILEQLSRLRRSWTQPLVEAHFNNAPFRIQFERPPRLGLLPNERKVEFRTQNRLGLAGSAVFHGGLLLIMLAGTLRALFGVDAVVDLMAGETLSPTAQSWAAQWPGVLAKPFQLATPLTLNSIQAKRYDSGELQEFQVKLTVEQVGSPRQAELAVNRDLHTPAGRLFLASQFGPAALLEWQSPNRPDSREAVLLNHQSKASFEGASAAGPAGLQAILRAHVDNAGHEPACVEVRVMQGTALRFTGEARVGDVVSLPGGEKLALRGTPFWARLRGSRDHALGLAYLGFALVIAGATIIFGIVKLDFCLVVLPAGERERVFLASKPQRFAPMFQERFEKVLREQGGLEKTDAPEQVAELAAQNRSTIAAAQNGKADKPQRHDGCRENRRGKISAFIASLRFIPAERQSGAPRSWLFLLLCVPALTSCQRASTDQARQLVERYNQVVSEAYRRCDVKLLDPAVGPNEGRKLTGLIGVRLDLGISLDAQLLSLQVTSVEQTKDEMRVRTNERWRYRDLKIGSGKQLGEESLDAYEMLYIFKNIDRAWVVDEIKFTAPPQVGRKQPTWVADKASSAATPAHTTPFTLGDTRALGPAPEGQRP